MDLQRWNPWRELEDVSRTLLGRRGELTTTNLAKPEWTPSVDVEETDEEFLITAELPGVDKKDVKVTTRDRVLAIEGERKVEKETRNKKLHRVERFYGSFARTFALPEGVDPAKLVADFDNGLLHVHLPKSESTTERAREVKIR